MPDSEILTRPTTTVLFSFQLSVLRTTIWWNFTLNRTLWKPNINLKEIFPILTSLSLTYNLVNATGSPRSCYYPLCIYWIGPDFLNGFLQQRLRQLLNICSWTYDLVNNMSNNCCFSLVNWTLDDIIKYFKFQIVSLENILCKKVFKVLTAKIKRIKHILPCSKHIN